MSDRDKPAVIFLASSSGKAFRLCECQDFHDGPIPPARSRDEATVICPACHASNKDWRPRRRLS